MAVSFDFKNRLGSGFFGEVWRAVDTGLDCVVALKCIPTDKIINQANFFQEAQVLKAAEHPNIVKVNETGTLADGRTYVSMEFLPSGSLEDQAQGAPVPLPQAKRLMIDVLRGLGHAHAHGIIHRDVKPANILIGNTGEGILSDFGLALPDIRGLDVNQLKQYQYALHLAPEIRGVATYNEVTDIYAAGVTMYRMVNGDSNLPQITPADAQQLARRGQFPPRDGYRDFIPRGLRAVINKAMAVDPSDRYQSADELRRAIERLSLCVGFSGSTSPTRTVWIGIDDRGRSVEVVKERQRNGKWSVECCRDGDTSALRRVGTLCTSEMRKQDADKRARRILQDLVLGRA